MNTDVRRPTHTATTGSELAGAAVFVLDPLRDARWSELLDRDVRASVFHSRGWLEALKRTYGYEPLVLTTTERGPLAHGVVLCRVRNWRSERLVSLPFSDHCEPLVDGRDDLSAVCDFLVREMGKKRWGSIELRPRYAALVPGFAADEAGKKVSGSLGSPGSTVAIGGLSAGASYCLHTLDLTRTEERIFGGFHHSSTQRAIRRAEREGLTYESGTSEALLSSFYRLLRLTRRRHGLPPQPIAWFQNLAACLGEQLTIHVASKDGLPVASILTLRFKKTMVYKYGGSDAAHHALGGMPFLFWRAIEDAHAKGIEELDLGRSDLDQPGLIAFKDHLGATRSTLTYYTCPERRRSAGHAGPISRAARHVVARAARHVVARLPDRALDLTGRLIYRYLG